MNTRKITYIDPKEDTLQKEVDWALQTTLEQRMEAYCNHLRSTYALAGVDIRKNSAKRNIYYMPEDES